MGWGALANGELLAAAEDAGLDVMITGDQNIAYQQNLEGRKLALVVLETNRGSFASLSRKGRRAGMGCPSAQRADPILDRCGAPFADQAVGC
jgi:hypothetical protein